jgi:hypothetical protein
MAPLDIRLRLRHVGFHPLPCRGKRPAVGGWPHHDADAAEIARWSKDYPDADNTGLLTRDTPVIDVDVYDADVAQDMKALVEGIIGEALVVRRGQGAKFALLFRTAEPFKKLHTGEWLSPDGVAHHVEILGDGQQFIAFGVHPDTGLDYAWDGASPLTVSPNELPVLSKDVARQIIAAARDLFRRHGWQEQKPPTPEPPPRKLNGGPAMGGSREQAYAQAALAGIAEVLASALEGQRNDMLNTCAYRAGRLVGADWLARGEAEAALLGAARACGLSATETFATLRSGLNAGEKNPHPGLGPSEVRHPEYEPRGQREPEPQHAKPTEQQQQPTMPLIQSSAQFTAGYVPPDYLIDGFLQLRFIYSFTARTGTGKTAVVLLIAAHVGIGRRLGNRDVEQGRVLIFAGENPDDIRARWIAMGQRLDFDVDSIPVYFFPGRFKISQLIERIRQEVEQIGGISLLIIDTSAAYFEGDDENNNVQAGIHAARLRHLNLPGGPCTIVCCHPPKNAADDALLPRGGGAFVAEVDGNLTARKDDMTVELHWQEKFRGPDFPPMNFLLHEVTHERLIDSKGRLVKTVVAECLSDMAKDELTRVAGLAEDEVLRAVKENKGASIADLAKALGWFMATGHPYKSKVQRILNRLKKDGLVRQERRQWVLSPKARKQQEDEE